MITGRQIREARQHLRLSASQLAKRAELTTAVVMLAEVGDGEPPITLTHADSIRQALEWEGVEFRAGEPCIRLRTTHSA